MVPERHMLRRRKTIIRISRMTALLLPLVLNGPLFSRPATPYKVTFTPYDDVRAVLKTFAGDLPEGLKNRSPEELADSWPGWVVARDAGIRARLLAGDEDSLVNFLLFGTSYTRQQRITFQDLGNKDEKPALDPSTTPTFRSGASLLARIDDFTQGLALPGNNDRLLFARQLIVQERGYDPRTASGRQQIKKYLLERLDRVFRQQASYAKTLAEARQSGNATDEFLERSHLFKDRGLSLDTSLRPNFAIEDSLEAMKVRNLLAPGSIRRVALIGPGLDFTDKQEGHDFYPLQTIQPFAVIDSLVHLGLTKADQLAVTTLDISPRINDHLGRARKRAAMSHQGYVVQLPRESGAAWTPGFVKYWKHFGDQIGDEVRPQPAPANAADVTIRAVRIRPAIVLTISPVDLNVVLQRLELPESEKFDLIIATNIFVYYDVFEQSLASVNIGRMLKRGGFLLSNNALIEFPFSSIRSVGYKTTVYSEKGDDGDHVVWYRRS
jgi:hypothetical protein